MAFYQNLKLILDSKGLSNYEAADKCGMFSQTIDNIINKKVRKPKFETLEKLSKGLDVSISKLLYGSDFFNSEHFYSILNSKKKTLEDLLNDIGTDHMLIMKNEYRRRHG